MPRRLEISIIIVHQDIRDPPIKKSFEAPEAKVLVVDDNDMNLLVAKKLLRETKVQLAIGA